MEAGQPIEEKDCHPLSPLPPLPSSLRSLSCTVLDGWQDWRFPSQLGHSLMRINPKWSPGEIVQVFESSAHNFPCLLAHPGEPPYVLRFLVLPCHSYPCCCEAEVGTQSISPLLWSIQSGSIEAAKAPWFVAKMQSREGTFKGSSLGLGKCVFGDATFTILWAYRGIIVADMLRYITNHMIFGCVWRSGLQHFLIFYGSSGG